MRLFLYERDNAGEGGLLIVDKALSNSVAGPLEQFERACSFADVH